MNGSCVVVQGTATSASFKASAMLETGTTGARQHRRHSSASASACSGEQFLREDLQVNHGGFPMTPNIAELLPEVDQLTESLPAPSKAATFIYLDQQAVLQADVLNMHSATRVIAEALSLFETGKCRQPY